MAIADVHSNLRRRDVLILYVANDCDDVDLLAYTR
jgi:hypothetical protein